MKAERITLYIHEDNGPHPAVRVHRGVKRGTRYVIGPETGEVFFDRDTFSDNEIKRQLFDAVLKASPMLTKHMK
jgi:hypothetical protein